MSRLYLYIHNSKDFNFRENGAIMYNDKLYRNAIRSCVIKMMISPFIVFFCFAWLRNNLPKFDMKISSFLSVF